MSQVSLFRKWRSQSFADLVGQEAVVRTLRNVLSGGSPARAYLFCGPRGTGKTSTARIFAKALCCEKGPVLEPCNQCGTCRDIAVGSCMDVFEIDAASHTQVDKIRDFIVDKVHFAPARARFKVYIIDEVHKLSSSSFNALLKTLEEPPSHVVFILATTHPHELLPTILSRCQRYDFRPFSIPEIRNRLVEIAQAENLDLSPEAATTLARSSEGSMRDALVLLEQAASYCEGGIKVEDVTRLLGLVPFHTLERLTLMLIQSNGGGLLELIQELAESGQDFARLGGLLQEHFRQLMLLRLNARDATVSELPEAAQESLGQLANQVSLPQILQWLKALMELQQGVREGAPPRLLCEITLVKLATPAGSAAAPVPGGPPALAGPSPEVAALRKEVGDLRKMLEQLAARPATPVATPPKVVEQGAPQVEVVAPKVEVPAPKVEVAPPRAELPPSPKLEPKPEPPPRPPAVAIKPPPPPAPPAKPPGEPVKDIKQFRQLLLNALRVKDKRLLGVLADAQFKSLEGECLTLTLAPQFKNFHFEEIKKNTAFLEELSQELLGTKIKIDCRVDEAHQGPSGEQEHDAMIRKAHGLFAGEIINS